MPALNLVLLLAILGGLTLFALQNWSPSLSLVFLGSPSPTLPLAVWILLGLTAGIMTGLSIAALFRWYSYLEARSLRRRPRYSDVSGEHAPGTLRYSHNSGDIDRESAYPADSSYSQESQASESDFVPSSQTGYQAHQGRESFDPRDDSSKKAAVANKGDRTASSSVPTNAADDWEQENKRYDDWEEVVTGASTEHVPRQSRGNEGDRAKADAGEKKDSFYSYGSQDKSNSGVGKPEDVYEANYRVITPPVREESAKGENDEDWGLDEDET